VEEHLACKKSCISSTQRFVLGRPVTQPTASRALKGDPPLQKI